MESTADIKKRKVRSTDWWKTPKTMDYINAQEAVENALDELLSIEEELHQRVEEQLHRRCRNHNPLMQSLHTSLIQCHTRREMALSPQWQAAWKKFTMAARDAEHATRLFRDEVEQVTGFHTAPPSRRH